MSFADSVGRKTADSANIHTPSLHYILILADLQDTLGGQEPQEASPTAAERP